MAIASETTDVEMAKLGASEETRLLVDRKTLQFRDISYQVKVTQESMDAGGGEGGDVVEQLKVGDQKQIVRGISGTVVGGSMLCILGPSGSGKTSLLHIISGRIKTTASGSHNVQGDVLVDNVALDDTAP